MRRFVLVLVTLVFVCSCVALAQGTVADEARHHFDVPHIVIDGIIAYHDKGPDAAVQTWIKSSPIDGSKEALNQANNLREIQSYYGAFRNFEVLATQDLSHRVRVVYVVLNYDKGPLFGRFILYRSVDQDWLLTTFSFNTNPDTILPTTMLTPTAPQ